MTIKTKAATIGQGAKQKGSIMFAPTFAQKLAWYATHTTRYNCEFAPTDLSAWLLSRKFQDSAEFAAWFLNLSKSRRNRIGRLIGIEPEDRHNARDLHNGYLSGVDALNLVWWRWDAWYDLHIERFCPTASGRRLIV